MAFYDKYVCTVLMIQFKIASYLTFINSDFIKLINPKNI